MCVRLWNKIWEQLQGGLLILAQPVNLGQTHASNESILFDAVPYDDRFLKARDQFAQAVETGGGVRGG